ncbi:uncharacterized protein K444DRAFT_609225 [Hyaloscypha bicolor E]|uniref:Uncharacterized protein n=1 Tax=Hyaloscypha bicolor E TaxID=1095630 RepID=A0A2J6TMM3_9HELO|nr:uncharacterized protein K444DRAFT_609225 [Hyaloscypha bicolor E]PMD64273.1 hypothetical protein K444DRAFT_609225 [Hyaloscypha bicolor E]
MEGFITRKRSLAELDTNAGRLPSPAPSSSLVQPSSRPAKKTKTVSRVADSTSRTKRTNKASAKSKVAQTPGHCSLNKKEFGDRIKNCLALEKYAVQRMSFQVEMDVSFFRSFFGGDHGVQITPEVYDEKTPVVVAELRNKEAGEVFGVSKIKNGNRYETVHLFRMSVILYPLKQTASVWISA